VDHFCVTKFQKIMLFGITYCISTSLAIAFAIYKTQTHCTIDDPFDCPTAVPPYHGCEPNLTNFGRYYFFVPLLTISALSTLIIFCGIAKVWSVNPAFLWMQWRLVATFFVFTFTVLLSLTYAISIDVAVYREETSEYISCVVTHPRDTENSPCQPGTSYSYGFAFAVSIIEAAMPVPFCCVAFFSLPWFVQWWKTLLCTGTVLGVNESIRSTQRPSHSSTKNSSVSKHTSISTKKP
jgi:hypothetical protein